MRVRLQSELKKGVCRWYLVRSQYVQGTGKHRTVRILYLGYPPNARIKRLVVSLNKSLRYSNEFVGEKILTKIKVAKQQLRARALIKRKLVKKRELKAWLRRNLFSDLVSKFADLHVLQEKLEHEEPMEQWPKDKLDKFIAAMKPLYEQIERAKKLFDEKSSVGR